MAHASLLLLLSAISLAASHLPDESIATTLIDAFAFDVPLTLENAAGAPRNVCVASGRRIGAADAARACATCGRRSIEAELRGRGTCPLCHARFDGETLAAVSDEEEKSRERTTVL